MRVVNTTRRRWQHWSESLWLRSPCAREPRCRQPIAFSSVWDKYLRTAVDQEWSAAAAGEAIRAALTLHRAANSRPDLQPLSVPALNVASAVMHAAAGKQRRVPAALLPEVAGAGGLAEALAAALGGLCGCGEQDEAADGEYAFLSELAAELLEALLGSKDDAAADAAWGKLAPSMLAACAWEGFKHATTLTPLLENLNRSAELLVDYLGVRREELTELDGKRLLCLTFSRAGTAEGLAAVMQQIVAIYGRSFSSRTSARFMSRRCLRQRGWRCWCFGVATWLGHARGQWALALSRPQ